MKGFIKETILMVIGVLFLSLLVLDDLLIMFADRLKYRPYTPFEVQLAGVVFTSKEDMKQRVQKIYGKLFIYLEKPLREEDHGRSRIWIRTVIINSALPDDMYGFILAHEMAHIKYRRANEYFIMYRTIVDLYESNDPVLQASALRYVQYIQAGEFDYDCLGYVKPYLEEKEVI